MDGLKRRIDDEVLEALEGQITELWGHINAATYRFIELVAEYDRIEGWAKAGCYSCAHWLNWRCGIDTVTAREKVRVARALRDLPRIREAFRLGQVSYSKVRAMTRVATPEMEDGLLNIARHGTAAHMERVVRLFRRVERLEEAARAEAQHKRRYLTYYYDHDGSVHIKGILPAETGAVVLKALQAAIDSLEKADTADRHRTEIDDSAELPATKAENPKRKSWEPPSPLQHDINESNVIGSKRADALRHLAEHFLQAGTKEDPSFTERYQVIVHIDEAALRDAEDPVSRSEIEDGPRLAIETAKRLACDGSVIGLVESEDGEPLSVGRKTRSIPRSIQRALMARDGGCKFPGCNRTRFTHGHHIEHWANGGETKLTNLVTVCRFHHRLVHEGGFDVKRTDDGLFIFTDPHGRRIPENGELYGSFHGNTQYRPPDPEELYTEHAELGIEIDAETIRSKWTGEQLDYDLAIGGLYTNKYGQGYRYDDG